MTTGIGASLTAFSPNSTIVSSAVNQNFASINSGGCSNDGGNITTDGAGNFNFGGKLSSGGTIILDGSGYDTYLRTRGSSNLVHLAIGSSECATFGLGGISVMAGNVSAASVLTCGVSFGIKTNSGGKLFEVDNGGNAIAAGQYKTIGGTSTIATGASFIGFDYAEVYPCDAFYPGGTVVCPAESGDRLTRCTHEGCHAALVVSVSPGMTLGGEQVSPEHGVLAIALMGRVNVRVSREQPITPRTLLCSDGRGGVRALRHGESGFTLGFALNARGGDGTVGLFLRPMYATEATS